MILMEQHSIEQFKNQYDNRIEIEKFGNFDILIKEILKIDPTYVKESIEVGKYTEWILNQCCTTDVDDINYIKTDLKDIISNFNTLKNISNSSKYKDELTDFNSNIYKYKTIEDVKNVINKYKYFIEKGNQRKTKKMQYGTEIDGIVSDNEQIDIISNDEWSVFMPLTTKQQIILGKETKWCISWINLSENKFESYGGDSNSPFLIFINNKGRKDQNGKSIKYQFHLSHKENTIWSNQDEKLDINTMLLDNISICKLITSIDFNNSKYYTDIPQIDQLSENYEKTDIYEAQRKIVNIISNLDDSDNQIEYIKMDKMNFSRLVQQNYTIADETIMIFISQTKYAIEILKYLKNNQEKYIGDNIDYSLFNLLKSQIINQAPKVLNDSNSFLQVNNRIYNNEKLEEYLNIIKYIIIENNFKLSIIEKEYIELTGLQYKKFIVLFKKISKIQDSYIFQFMIKYSNYFDKLELNEFTSMDTIKRMINGNSNILCQFIAHRNKIKVTDDELVEIIKEQIQLYILNDKLVYNDVEEIINEIFAEINLSKITIVQSNIEDLVLYFYEHIILSFATESDNYLHEKENYVKILLVNKIKIPDVIIYDVINANPSNLLIFFEYNYPITDDMLYKQIKNNGYYNRYLIKDIPINYMPIITEKVQIAQVKNFDMSLYYILKYGIIPSDKVQWESLKRYPDTFRDLLDHKIIPSDHILKLFKSKYPDIELKYLYSDKNLQLELVKQDPRFLNYIKYPDINTINYVNKLKLQKEQKKSLYKLLKI